MTEPAPATSLIVPGRPDESHRLPTALPSFNQFDDFDFIFDDVRMRFLQIVRALSLGNKSVRVDVAPAAMPGPSGPQAALMLCVSVPSPIIGQRLAASIWIDKLEPKDEVLREFGTQLYNAAMDRRHAITNDPAVADD